MYYVISAIQDILDIIYSSINPSIIAIIVGILLASGIVIYLTWFGIKKLITVIDNALYGNLSTESIKARKWYKKEGYKHYRSYDEYKHYYNAKYGVMDGNYID